MKAIFLSSIMLCSLMGAGVHASTVLFNFGTATQQTGWNTYTQASGAGFSTTGTDVNGEGAYTVTASANGGNFSASSFSNLPTWTTGTFDGIAGTALDEMQQTLGLTSPIGTDIWNTSLNRGNGSGNTLTISGLVAGNRYTFYCIVGNPANTHGLTQNALNADAQTSLSYYNTANSTGAYTIAERASSAITVNNSNMLLVKLENVVANDSGEVKFTMGGDRSAINALAFTETIPEPSTITLGILTAGLLFMRRRKM